MKGGTHPLAFTHPSPTLQLLRFDKSHSKAMQPQVPLYVGAISPVWWQLPAPSLATLSRRLEGAK